MSLFINQIIEEATETLFSKGFTHSPPETDLGLLHSEVCEAEDEFRRGRAMKDSWYEEEATYQLPDTEVWDTSDCTTPLTPQLKVVPGQLIHYTVRHKEPWLGEKMLKPCGIPSELADLLIRTCTIAGKYGIDLEQAVREKMAYNKTRPHRHGGKRF